MSFGIIKSENYIAAQDYASDYLVNHPRNVNPYDVEELVSVKSFLTEILMSGRPYSEATPSEEAQLLTYSAYPGYAGFLATSVLSNHLGYNLPMPVNRRSYVGNNNSCQEESRLNNAYNPALPTKGLWAGVSIPSYFTLDENVEYQIFDLSGRLISKNRSIERRPDLDQDGVYLLRLQNNLTGAVYTTKYLHIEY